MSDEFWPRDKATRRHVLIQGIVSLSCGLVACAPGIRAQSARAKKGTTSRETPPAVILGQGAADLPPAVADMRAEIQAAVETGSIAEIKRAMDLNELKPEFGTPVGKDPLDFLRSLSPDGTGASVLAELGRLIDAKWAAIPGGRDIENNRMYVWPHFAEVPLDKLSEDDRTALEAVAGAEAAKAMIAANQFRGWRLSIGADGVWHTFMRVGD